MASISKQESLCVSCGVVFVILRSAVLIQYQSVTDRQTAAQSHTQTHDNGVYRASIASRGKNDYFYILCVWSALAAIAEQCAKIAGGIPSCSALLSRGPEVSVGAGGHVTKCPRGHVARRHYKFNQRRPCRPAAAAQRECR